MFRPGNDKVVVKLEEAVAKTEAGLEIPEGARERPLRGVVQFVGKDVTDYVVGDVIVFPKWTGFDVKILEQDMIIMYADEVWGVYEEE